MKRFAILIACAAIAFGAQATPQQDKMKSCNAEAKTNGKKGDERKAFMKECLSATPAAPAASAAPSTQQEKMKACNADAKGKKGAERKTFMKECLSSKPA